MKVYLPHNELERTSGIGKAITKQIEYLQEEGINCVFRPEKGVDLVHINSIFDFKNIFILYGAHIGNVPLVTHGHSTKQDWLNSFWFAKITKPYVYKQIHDYYSFGDLVITPTPYSRSLILGYGYNDNVVTISNGIDVDLSNKNIKENIEKFKTICNLKDDDQVVLGIGHPFLRKGIDDFFAVAKQFPNLKFVWCGHVPHILLPRKVRKLLRHKPSNVIMPGFIDANAVRGAMHFSKCFFFPSREETEGIVVLESLACKCPLVIRDIGVYDYWLKDGVNCYKGLDCNDFTNIINKVLTSDSTKLVDNGFKLAKERDKSIISKQLAQTYQRVIYEKQNRKECIRKVR